MYQTPVVNTGLVFDDEFNSFTSSGNGTSGSWMTNFTFGGEGAYTLSSNHESQFYSSETTGPNSPFSLKDGVLNITAFKASNWYNLPYTSGLITTAKSFSMTYGYFEARMQLPAGQGLWPAFWMLPVTPNGSPTELDSLEMLGNDPTTIYSTTHGSSGVSQAFHVSDTSAGFHTYGVDWEPITTTFYMDGRQLGSTLTPTSMNSPMYMLLNLAVGGNGSWPGAPNAATITPATMQVDYVRAYTTAGTTYVGGPASYAAPIVNVIGSGPDTLSFVISEDAYQGDAQFTISIDGKQVGGIQTATASHTSGTGTTFQINGSFATGKHVATINFLNDLYGGSVSTDRNLYVDSVSLNGTNVVDSSLTELITGPQSVSFYGYSAAAAYQPTTIIGSGKDVLSLQIAEDAYQGDAQFTISVDGTQVGGTQTATALHGRGATQAFDVLGNFSNGAHSVAINFLNDAYNGSPMTDRNLYVESATINSAVISSGQLVELQNGSHSIDFQNSSKPDTLTIGVSEDSYKGDAKYVILVDGYIQGSGTYVATASHSAGQVNLQTLNMSLSSGFHQVGISFLNDFSDAGGDRNLYINSVSYNGSQAVTSTVEQASSGTSYVSVQGSPATSNLTLHLAEDAYQGNAQFLVTVDGKQVGDVQSVSALAANGATQAFNFGARLTAGVHDVGVSFINDCYGGSMSADRNLYVNGAELNGTSLNSTGWNASMMSNGTDHFSLVVPS